MNSSITYIFLLMIAINKTVREEERRGNIYDGSHTLELNYIHIIRIYGIYIVFCEISGAS